MLKTQTALTGRILIPGNVDQTHFWLNLTVGYIVLL